MEFRDISIRYGEWGSLVNSCLNRDMRSGDGSLDPNIDLNPVRVGDVSDLGGDDSLDLPNIRRVRPGGVRAPRSGDAFSAFVGDDPNIFCLILLNDGGDSTNLLRIGEVDGADAGDDAGGDPPLFSRRFGDFVSVLDETGEGARSIVSDSFETSSSGGLDWEASAHAACIFTRNL